MNRTARQSVSGDWNRRVRGGSVTKPRTRNRQTAWS